MAADASGNLYVAWHAGPPGSKDEGERRVWIARSQDDGRTFSAPRAASEPSTGACGCCGLRALTDRQGTLYVLYRSAAEIVHRDTLLLRSSDRAATFSTMKLQEWNIGACPMSTFALAESSDHVLAAWETAGQVYWTELTRGLARPSTSPVASPGEIKNRRHPAIARNARGETLLVWTEGTAWNRGGSMAWQLFDRTGKAPTSAGRLAGVPIWGTVAVAAGPDGRFVVVY